MTTNIIWKLLVIICLIQDPLSEPTSAMYPKPLYHQQELSVASSENQLWHLHKWVLEAPESADMKGPDLEDWWTWKIDRNQGILWLSGRQIAKKQTFIFLEDSQVAPFISTLTTEAGQYSDFKWALIRIHLGNFAGR